MFLSLDDTSRFFRVCLHLKCTCIHICYRWFCTFLRYLVNMVLQYGTTYVIVRLLESAFYWLSSCLWRTLSTAHLGYLHCLRTSSRCGISLVSSCGVKHMALTLYVWVLSTLYLDARLWWLSQWRYKSVWVGFLYKPVVKVPSACGVIMTSTNGTEPSDLVSSTVNWMEGSIDVLEEFIPVWLVLDYKSVNIPLPNSRGFNAVVIDLCSKASI